VGGAVAVGPLIGGIITEGLGWEWIFFINIPIGGAAVLLTQRKLANVPATDYYPIDWGGLITFSLALFALIFGLIRGNAEGWSSAPILTALIGAALLLVAFFVIESRREHAMLDLSLFKVKSFTGANTVAWALSATQFSLFLYITLFLQDIFGLEPLAAGACFLPLSLLSFFVAPISANLSERIPVQVLMGLGLTLAGVGLLLMRSVAPGDDWTVLLPGFIVSGIGVGMVNPLIAEVALGVVHPARAGMASGINSTFRQIGISTGVAGLGAIFHAQILDSLSGVPAQFKDQFADAVSAGAIDQAASQAPPDIQQQLIATGESAFTSGFNEILLIGGIVAIVGGVIGALLVRRSDFVQLGPPPGPGEAPEQGEQQPEPTAA
jgi:predicted MFS family arabinose efflux permease